jgi:6-pyruvoyltetrahydropterin/6-carboxytetrahydropterin synthase
VFRVARRYQFAASHRLHSARLSDEENRRVYGKCNHPFGHGHNYVLEVIARGPLHEATGRAVDLEALDEMVRREVIGPMDHHNLNTDVESLAGIVPTSENLAVDICRRLKQNWAAAFPGQWPKLEKVRIVETARNIFEMKADEID